MNQGMVEPAHTSAMMLLLFCSALFDTDAAISTSAEQDRQNSEDSQTDNEREMGCALNTA
jgi:hypothetical protein